MIKLSSLVLCCVVLAGTAIEVEAKTRHRILSSSGVRVAPDSEKPDRAASAASKKSPDAPVTVWPATDKAPSSGSAAPAVINAGPAATNAPAPGGMTCVAGCYK